MAHKHKLKLVPLPPLPWNRKALAPEGPAVPETVRPLVVIAPGLTNVLLRWENVPWPWAAGWRTRIDGTTNLTDYYEITNVPYVTNGTAILSNRPAKIEFYRVRNGLLMEKEWE